jgi:Ca-activated chloride channel family protein
MNEADEILLTSYLLGEATAEERAACEDRLARDPEFRRAAEELRRVVAVTAAAAKRELGASAQALAAAAPTTGSATDGSATVVATPGAAARAEELAAPPFAKSGRGRAFLRAAAAVLVLLTAGESYRRLGETRESTDPRPAVGTLVELAADTERGFNAAPSAAGVPSSSKTELDTFAEEMTAEESLAAPTAETSRTWLPATPAPSDTPEIRELLVRAANGTLPREPVRLNSAAAKRPERRKLLADRDALSALQDDVSRDREPPSGEEYEAPPENPFVRPVGLEALSTFAADVDTASYANVRRMIDAGAAPPPAAVRLEEFVNAFRYRDAAPDGDRPLAVRASFAECPWRPRHRLLRVTLKARELDFARRPRMNLVFLLDVSGSMDQPNKLPLVVRAMRLLADQLGENDRISIVVYAGASGTALPTTSGDRRVEIRAALERLQAGGSTNRGDGIRLAYRLARESFLEGGVNRVVLCTDGDFNVGTTAREELENLITTEARSGVFLTALGFGYGNLKDATLEMLANKGDGNYGYVSDDREARKLLVEGFAGTMVAVAKDVKLQVEFNPATVLAYRLLGYENRRLNAEDFRDDTKDAGEVGAGHVVTALYEIVPNEPGAEVPGAIGPLKYQPTASAEPRPAGPGAPVARVAADEYCTVRVRYLPPEGGAATELAEPVKLDAAAKGVAAEELRFAGAVALFGLKLRRSPTARDVSWPFLAELAAEAAGTAADLAIRDPHGERAEFLALVRKAAALDLGRR